MHDCYTFGIWSKGFCWQLTHLLLICFEIRKVYIDFMQAGFLGQCRGWCLQWWTWSGRYLSAFLILRSTELLGLLKGLQLFNCYQSNLTLIGKVLDTIPLFDPRLRNKGPKFIDRDTRKDGFNSGLNVFFLDATAKQLLMQHLFDIFVFLCTTHQRTTPNCDSALLGNLFDTHSWVDALTINHCDQCICWWRMGHVLGSKIGQGQFLG